MIGPDGIVQRVRLAAYAWSEDGDRVLLVRIAPGEADSGRWTLPGGGCAFGEDPAEGARRELREETGLEVELGEVLGIRSAVYGPARTRSGHRIHFVGVLYRARIAGGDLRHEPDGSTDLAAWQPFDALDALPAVELLDWARARAGR